MNTTNDPGGAARALAGLVWHDLGPRRPDEHDAVVDALGSHLDASSCWRRGAIPRDRRAAIGTPLPRWTRPGHVDSGRAAVLLDAFDQLVPAGADHLRVQVDTTGEASELRGIGDVRGAPIVPSLRSRGSMWEPLVWRWPLRVGVVRSDRSSTWGDDVRVGSHHGVVDAVDVIPSDGLPADVRAADVVIVHREDLVAAAPGLSDTLRRSTCVIAAGDGDAADLLHEVDDVISPVLAIGVGAPPHAWWRELCDAMTHDLPIDVAVDEARRRAGVDAEIAGPRHGMDVTAAARWFVAVAPHHDEMAFALDDVEHWDWSSEGGGATNAAELARSARAGGADPHVTVEPTDGGSPLGSSAGAPSAPADDAVLEDAAPAGEPPPFALTTEPEAGAVADAEPPTARGDAAAPRAPGTTTDARAVPGRFVRAVVETDDGPRGSFVADRPNRLRCWIGPDRDEPGSVASEPVAELGRDVVLDVALVVDRAVVATGSLFLPAGRSARSSDCELEVPAGPAGFFAGELAFTLDGRMYELVAVKGVVVGPDVDDVAVPELQLDSLVELRQVTERTDRAPSAGVLDVVHDGDDIVVREFGPRSTGVYDLTAAAPVVAALTKALYATEVSLVRREQRRTEPVDDRTADDLDPAWTDVLRRMAKHGWLLHRRLVQQGFDAPGERFEIINRLPETYVPLEFVYDRGNPADDAGLDPACLAALRDGGECGCHAADELTDAERDRNPRICPFGFWSLSKVIERHDADTHGRLEGSATSTDAVHRLHPIGSVLAGWSGRVRREDADVLVDDLRRSGCPVATADSWTAWREQLATGPAVLLALPHHEEVDGIGTLEIGAGSRLELGQALDLYVRTPAGEPGPVLILLGCETDVTGELGHPSFARAFSPYASVVVGTLSKVLGRHAAPLAERLVAALVERQAAGGDVGTVMRDVRRSMFADGYLMALGVIALGDADWQLESGTAA